MVLRHSSIVVLLIVATADVVCGQDTSTSYNDTTKVLNEVVVNAYLYNRPINEVPTAVAALNSRDFERFNNTSFLPAVNTVPGVRMEERSPGSYRFSIRGSLLRSPFGVRNVKMYWNGLPLTDGGGNTYLNLIDFNAIANLEIIKGPGASLYGAGTGGVVLLRSEISRTPGIKFSTVLGSYGLQRYQLAAQGGTDKVKASIQYAHQEADGYREQTAMRRDALNADVSFALNPRNTLLTSVFYTDLFYETPGGLTKAQFDQDPRQARPPKTSPPPLPGAVEAKASVRNKTGYAGIVHEYEINDKWSTRTGVYGSVTSFENPTIRNYESRDETNLGIRSDTQYSLEKKSWNGKLTLGGEYQYFFSPVMVYNNDSGSPGTTIQSNDELTSQQFLLFAQADINLPKDFNITLGGSTNFLRYDFLSQLPPPTEQQRKFDPVFSPRIALLKKITSSFSVYANVSKGFSPPSLAEVRPSAGTYNNSLNPERGISFEAGARGNLFKEQLVFDVNAYDFQLDETIVIQRTADGAEYFINAGKTSQRGIEAQLSWLPNLNSKLISSFRLWSSYTYNHYRFEDYVQDGNDYSGNRLTGVAPTIVLFGADVMLWKVYFNVTANYTDAIPLNDANTEYASEYFLLGGRLGYRTKLWTSMPFDIFAGVDNALDKTYSLGNDLNAVGGRYYNAAADRNYFIGLSINPQFKKK